MSEEESWRAFQRMERQVYGKLSYLIAGETNLEPWEVWRKKMSNVYNKQIGGTSLSQSMKIQPSVNS